MEPSTELKALYLRSCEAQSNGDYAFFERYFSKEDGVLAIGTDPAEWWSGYDTITRVFEAQLKETDGIRVIPDTPLAYCHGSVGWVAGRPTLKLPDGTEMTVRLTTVYKKEKDDWKIVQWHFSTGIPNEELIDETLTT
jgi:ketosteroid isomerase-like protein